MSGGTITRAIDGTAMLQWVGGLGAVTAEALADREGTTVSSARARLAAAVRARLLSHARPLAAQPALYALTRAGVRASRIAGLQPCRVSASNALHLIVCAGVAAGLERCYPDHGVIGERDLRRREREAGAPLASARLGRGSGEERQLHRPDLVLLPAAAERGLPVAVEVELAVKAPRRLTVICRSWARCKEVAGVLYLATPGAERALLRALAEADARSRVVVVPLDALPGAHARALAGAESL